MNIRLAKTILIIALTITCAIFLSLCLGTYFISPAELIKILSGKESVYSDIIFHLRLPRMAVAFIAGSSLSVSGVLFQSMLKNPLADPYTLGVSGGASFGAAAAIIAGLSYPTAALSALIIALAVALVLFIFSKYYEVDNSSLILGGIAISIFFSSAVMLLFSLADSQSVHKALMWLMGDLSLARTEYAIPSGAACFTIIISSLFFAQHLNLLSFGTAYARAAGVSRSHSAALFWIATSLAAMSVALCGIISFVGLIVPHIVRRFAGSDHKYLIPASALAGGAFLPLCDSIGRLAAQPYEIPSGVITGCVGGIFLIISLVKNKKG